MPTLKFPLQLGALVLMIFSLIRCASAQSNGPVFTDANWISMGGPRGVAIFEGDCVLADTNKGLVYVGGNFFLAGNAQAMNIACWNGTNWSALGAGLGMNGDVVVAMALDAKGNLYAGGSFTNSGGLLVSNIAMWNGTNWSSLGTGIDGYLKSLLVDHSGNLYAAGGFTNAGVGATNVAVWNGTSWSALGPGLSSGPNTTPLVYALGQDQSGNIYAGGSFTIAGSTPATNIAVWGSGAWSQVGAGLNNAVRVIAFDHSGNLIAGGSFTSAGSVAAKSIAEWNGGAWSALSTGLTNTVAALTIDSANNVYTGLLATGGPVWEWNGSGWSAIIPINGTRILGMTFDGAGSLYVCGFFSSAGSVVATSIFRYDGSTCWALAPGSNSVNQRIQCEVVDQSGNLYAGGYFTTAGNALANCVAEWNGTNWSSFGTGLGNPLQLGAFSVYALALDKAGNLYAGGSFTNAGSLATRFVAKWNGSSWSALGSGMNNVVYTLAMDGSGNLYAGGSFTNAGGVSAKYIAKWNGTSWSAVGSGLTSTTYKLMFDSSGNLYAGGIFGVYKWNGSAWTALGTLNGSSMYGVGSFAIDRSGNIYAAGVFPSLGGVSGNIAKWNGSSWSSVGTGLDSNVESLVMDGLGNLYAGGVFRSAGSAVVNGLAKWDGTNWWPMGSGVNGPVINYEVYGSVYALVLDSDNHLYVGGEFGTAGTNISYNFAEASLLLGPGRIDITEMANGMFTLILSGTPGGTYIVQSSTDLIHWQDISTNICGTNGNWSVANASNSKQNYFRSVLRN